MVQRRGFTSGHAPRVADLHELAKLHYQKTIAAMLQNNVVRCRTTKNSLPWVWRTKHDKKAGHGKISTSRTALFHARQSITMTHGKDSWHGKKQKRRTAKNSARQRRTPLPCMATMPCATVTNTVKEPLPCSSPLPCVILAFSIFSFMFYSFYYLCLFLN
jgi:hypothetical protein